MKYSFSLVTCIFLSVSADETHEHQSSSAFFLPVLEGFT